MGFNKYMFSSVYQWEVLPSQDTTSEWRPCNVFLTSCADWVGVNFEGWLFGQHQIVQHFFLFFVICKVNGAPPTLCHYRSKVAQLFRACGRGKRLFFENSRWEFHGEIICISIYVGQWEKGFWAPLEQHLRYASAMHLFIYVFKNNRVRTPFFNTKFKF